MGKLSSGDVPVMQTIVSLSERRTRIIIFNATVSYPRMY